MILGIIGKQLTLIIQKENLDRMKKGDPMFLDLGEDLRLMVCYEELTNKEIKATLTDPKMAMAYLTRGYKDLPGDDLPLTPL